MPGAVSEVGGVRRGGLRLSDEMRVALGPGRTYDALVLTDAEGSWPRVFGAAGLVLIVFAAVASVAATRVISLPTLLTVAVCWAFVPAIQLLTGLVLCRRPPESRVTRQRALELYFLAHVPWSLWLLAVALAALWLPPGAMLVNLIYVTALVPMVWTPALIAGFCRSALGCTAAQARRRTIVHQAATWTVIAAFIVMSIQPWARYGGGA